MLMLQPAYPEDKLFLFEVYKSTRAEELAAAGWSEEQLMSFLHMQHEMQQRSYQNQYPGEKYQIVVLDGVRIGRMLTVLTDGAWMLVDLALLPPYRNLGLGTMLIEALKVQAAESRKPIRLSVLDSSPAEHWYKRLGFYTTERQFPYIAMEWTPNGADVEEVVGSK